MGKLIEIDEFTEEIYQLEVTDFVEGGENGVDNKPHKALANRTRWLKSRIDAFLAGTGLTKAMVGLANVDNTADLAKPISTATQTALNAKEPTISILPIAKGGTGKSTALVKADVGLSNVDNTSDLNKPLSTAETNALALKANIASPTFTGTVRGVFPIGTIVMFNGTTIPSLWYLCDGTNGTPNLKDRFVIGSGGAYTVGAFGGSANAVVVSHVHGASSANAGTHNHSAWTGDSGNHTHQVLNTSAGGGTIGTFYYGDLGNGVTGNNNEVSYGGTHSHGVGIGDSTAHSHAVTVSSSGESGINKNLPPFYALAYIMYKGA
jgi:hypothetical protein